MQRYGFRLLLALLSFAPLMAYAAGGLIVHPTRIILTDKDRSAQIDLTNSAAEAVTYRLSLENKRMTDEGTFVAVKEAGPGDQFASDMLRYSPRQVDLAPGAGQTIRLLLRKPANLPPGEYRSHLVFSRVPTASMNNIENKQELGPNEIGISLKPLIGVSIPVIVRHGETSATAALSNLKLSTATKKDPAILAIKLERSGNRSLYGDLVVSFTPKGATAATQIGAAAGLAVYTPNAFRNIKLPLSPPEGLKLSNGTINVLFREQKVAGGKILAETTLPIQ